MDILKKKRSSIKGSISRIEKYISELKTSDTVDLEQVKARLQKLETFFANFEETQDQIDEMEDDDTYRQEMEDKYFEIKSQCLALLNPERASMSIDPRQIIRREEVDAFSNILQSFTEQQATMNSLLRQLVIGSNTVSAQPPLSINTSVDGPGVQPGPSIQVEAPSSIITQPIHSSISLANIGQSSVSNSTTTPIIFSSAANYTPASTFIPLTSVPLMTSSPVTIPTGTEFLNNNNCTLQGASTDLQLPKINIPVFYGQYEEWPAFHDLFSSLVHNSATLSPAQKFQFLKSSLRGEAASLFKHLTISDANYVEAWNELNSRYNKEKYIIEAHLRNIMEQTSIHQQPSANALRKLCNSIKESVRALKALKLPTDSWDCWLNFIVVQKLDSETRQLWARRSSVENRPTFQFLMDFLDEREFELQSVQFNRKHSHKSNRSDTKQIYTVSITECVKCKGSHALYKCPEFLSLNLSLRKSFITKQALCQNCIRSGHQSKNCRFSSCRICHKRHHTLIHDSVSSSKSDSNNEQEQEPIIQSIQRPSMSLHLRSLSNNIMTILPTAIVLIDDCRHQPQPCRALLDSGSQATLITESCIQRLQLRRLHSRTPISGLDSSECQYSRGGVNITIKSRINPESVQVTALILSKLSHLLPPHKVNIQSLEDINNLHLADETFSDAGPIDLIIGSDIFFNILQDNRIVLDSGLIAQNTIFGYIIGGKSTSEPAIGISSFHIQTDLDNLLQRFWELDELKINEPHLTEDEVLCENHYISTHRRELDGRYVVQLPFKPQLISEKLGESGAAALRSLYIMEKRFDKDESFRQQYAMFMDEYITLNHMRPITELEPNSDCYYIPHHAVIKNTSSTTKLRVVFNASKSTSTGLSLNEKLLIGPIIQHELVTILMRFRTHKIAFTADIAKMYRQIRMNDGDTKFQRILWRSSNSQPVKAYELLTVTYGTSPAPFLATRTLKQLALDEGNEYPLGAKTLQTDFYVDDTMSGSDTLEQAIENVNQLRQLLSRGGFIIRKWASNSEQLLEHIPEEHRELQSNLPLEEDACIKTLGLNWNVKGDYFFFKVTSSERCSTSKRQILSEIAKIFDPLGWLAPCVVRIKLIIQRLWVAGISWDSELPLEILKEWEEFQKDFKVLESIRIPRWTPCFQLRLEYHTFADASEVAYAAVVYLRTVDSYNRTAVHLIASKTRVAPIKQVSLPRLELCAAHLATKLLIKVRDGLQFPQSESYGWTDSTIVLSLLSDIPKRWETFIANRSAEILSTLPRSKWRHVRSAQNAADCASRGLSPKGLLMHEIWWKGPKFLHQEPIKHDELINMPVTTLERRKKNVFHNINDSEGNQDLLMRYSSLTRLKRITAHCLRFQHNATVEKESERIYEPLSLRELQNALNIWIRRAQQDTFADELKLIRNKQSLPERNKLSSLAPFIDQCGILRIGGRLEEANIAFTRKHPAILPKAHPFTKLLLLDLHLRYFHAGQRLLTNLVLMNYGFLAIGML